MTRKIYVGLTKISFADEDMSVGPADTAAVATIPEDATVIGWRVVNQHEYVVWVCDV